MKTLIAVAMLSLAMSAGAACPVKRPAQAPAIPDGASATEREMHKGQLAAENYILQVEAYMDCNVMNSRQHTAMAVQLDTFRDALDEEVLEHQVRSHMVADK